MAQPYIHLCFTWQAWHNLTSTFVSRGRRGTHGTPQHFAWQVWHNVTSNFVTYHLSHTITSHTQSHIHLRFAWQAWRNLTSTFVSRGRRGTILHPHSFCVAGVALLALRGALGSGLGAPWSRVTPWHFAWQAWHLAASTFVSRGRRGTISHPPSFRVAGVALRGILRGRCGTTLHPTLSHTISHIQ